MTRALQPSQPAHASEDVSREFLIGALVHINMSWVHSQELLDDAAIELGVGLELHECDLATETAESEGHNPLEEFFSFLKAAGLPSRWHGTSTLDGLSEQDLLLAHARNQIDHLRWLVDRPSAEHMKFAEVAFVRIALEKILVTVCYAGRSIN